MTKICSILTLALLILQIILVNAHAGSGDEVAFLQSKINSLTLANLELRKQVLQKTSILSLEKKAMESGFTGTKVAFEKSPAPVAQIQR